MTTRRLTAGETVVAVRAEALDCGDASTVADAAAGLFFNGFFDDFDFAAVAAQAANSLGDGDSSSWSCHPACCISAMTFW